MSAGCPDPPRFTTKQGQYLAFIHAYTLVLGRPPAEADIQRFFRVSPPSVHQMIVSLEKAGLIARQPHVPRSIAVLVDRKHLPELLPSRDQPVRTAVPKEPGTIDSMKPHLSPGSRASPVARCHCERSEAISRRVRILLAGDCFAALAMTPGHWDTGTLGHWDTGLRALGSQHQ